MVAQCTIFISPRVHKPPQTMLRDITGNLQDFPPLQEIHRQIFRNRSITHVTLPYMVRGANYCSRECLIFTPVTRVHLKFCLGHLSLEVSGLEWEPKFSAVN